MMVKIAERTEQEIKGHSVEYSNLHSKRSISSAVCNAAVQTAVTLELRLLSVLQFQDLQQDLHLS